MLDVAKTTTRRQAICAAPAASTSKLSVATANPKFQVSQAEAAVRAPEIYPHLEALWPLVRQYRHRRPLQLRADRLVPAAAHLGGAHRFVPKARARSARGVTLAAVKSAGMELNAIDMIVTNTVTGLAIPSLDAKLFNRLKLKPTIERLPIFGLGCGGGVAGLARATRLAHAMPGAHVLFLTVDLCSLCLRINDPSTAMFVSAALFGDGAAGVVLRNTSGGAHGGPRIAPSANGAGPTPSTSWAGTSRTTASAWCSARNCRR